jgi:FkbH-like protein
LGHLQFRNLREGSTAPFDTIGQINSIELPRIYLIGKCAIMKNAELKSLLALRSEKLWDELDQRTRTATHFEDLLFLNTMRRRALPLIPTKREKLRLAILGGCSLYPLRELIEQTLFSAGFSCEIFTGEFDNYISEAMDPDSALYAFEPQLVIMIPSDKRCHYRGKLTDPRQVITEDALRTAEDTLELCRQVHARTRAEVILTNYLPPSRLDPGLFRTRTLASEWNFRKSVNMELGLHAPGFVHLCDLEFLSSRRGTLSCRDEKGWFESKQLFSPDFMVDVAHEVAHIARSLRQSAKKVLVLDLDNTLWGGVIGDDGLEGIELGDTSARGEAFKSFQRAILSLTERGVLLAIASKNDHEKAIEPFEKHPDMVLKSHHIVSFKANWNPKSDNIRQIANDLELGLDSFVFVDDNPAEVDIVRQYVPEVATLLLSADPSEYAGQLLDGRWFEPRSITEEDAARTQKYHEEGQRKSLLVSSTNMDDYLASLEMSAQVWEFQDVDVARISQLINKSNQFNLTTRRRTESEVRALLHDPDYTCFTVRLADRFGDHGLISVVCCRQEDSTLVVDTWLMSCRVLKRQVEELVLNEIFRISAQRNCRRVLGIYLRTSKNGMVQDLYPRMGFALVYDRDNCSEYALDSAKFTSKPTHIRIERKSHDSD